MREECLLQKCNTVNLSCEQFVSFPSVRELGRARSFLSLICTIITKFRARRIQD